MATLGSLWYGTPFVYAGVSGVQIQAGSGTKWRERKREREGNPAPCTCPQTPPPPPHSLRCFFFLLTHFSSYCLHYLNAWNRLPGDGCLKKMVSAHCAEQCINHSPKVKKLVSGTVHLPLYSRVK